jgi:hypothetical protein
LLKSSRDVFTTSASLQNPTPQVFAPDFGAQRMARNIQIMRMSKEELLGPWERCIENALSIKTSVEDELERPLFAKVPFDGSTALPPTVLVRRRISNGHSTTSRSSRNSFGVVRGRESSHPS